MLYPAHFKKDCKSGIIPEKGYDAYRKYNYDLCKAINLTKLGVILDKMVKSGKMNEDLAVIYKAQADALLAALRSENNRAFSV